MKTKISFALFLSFSLLFFLPANSNEVGPAHYDTVELLKLSKQFKQVLNSASLPKVVIVKVDLFRIVSFFVKSYELVHKEFLNKDQDESTRDAAEELRSKIYIFNNLFAALERSLAVFLESCVAGNPDLEVARSIIPVLRNLQELTPVNGSAQVGGLVELVNSLQSVAIGIAVIAVVVGLCLLIYKIYKWQKNDTDKKVIKGLDELEERQDVMCETVDDMMSIVKDDIKVSSDITLEEARRAVTILNQIQDDTTQILYGLASRIARLERGQASQEDQRKNVASIFSSLATVLNGERASSADVSTTAFE